MVIALAGRIRLTDQPAGNRAKARADQRAFVAVLVRRKGAADKGTTDSTDGGTLFTRGAGGKGEGKGSDEKGFAEHGNLLRMIAASGLNLDRTSSPGVQTVRNSA
jgi:hypothetical protein